MKNKGGNVTGKGQREWLTTREAVALLGGGKDAAIRRTRSGELAAETVHANGGEQYRIRFDSLPPDAKARCYVDRYKLDCPTFASPLMSAGSEAQASELWRKFEDASGVDGGRNEQRTRRETLENGGVRYGQ
jgi:hypothetical protein